MWAAAARLLTRMAALPRPARLPGLPAACPQPPAVWAAPATPARTPRLNSQAARAGAWQPARLDAVRHALACSALLGPSAAAAMLADGSSGEAAASCSASQPHHPLQAPPTSLPPATAASPVPPPPPPPPRVTSSTRAPAAPARPPAASPGRLEADWKLRAAVAVPPGPEYAQLSARVEHMQAPRAGRLSQLVCEALDLPQWFVAELLRFGAIHWCPVPPLPRPELAAQLSAERLAALHASRAAAVAQFGKHPGLAQPARAAGDAEVNQGAYVRVHLHPKRFPAAYAVDWPARIVAAAPGYVVVDKPAGVPVVPTIDNLLECCLSLAAQAVGAAEALRVTHRLDTCTSGLVLLAATRAAAARFNALLQWPGAVTKLYRTLSAAPPAVGTMVHYVSTGQRTVGLPTRTAVHADGAAEGARCELRVLRTGRVALTGAAAADWGDAAWESEVELVTGRTHQIRAQFAAHGTPLLGDTLYCQPNAPAPEVATLQVQIDAGALAGSERAFQEPAGGIGLQAFQLRVEDPEGVFAPQPLLFQAGAPWWRA